jgi:hypothetical protein
VARLIFALLLVPIFLSISCSRHAAYIETAADPSISVRKEDPIFVTLPEKSSIRERRLLPVLRSELCKNGFQVVESIGASKWVLGLTQSRTSLYGGSESTTIAVPNTPIINTRTQSTIVDQTAIYLRLFDARQFGKPSPLAVWEGSGASTEKVIQIYEKVVIKNTLDFYGKTFSGRRRLSKDYLNSPDKCGANDSHARGQ